jgi:hypothetical protein
MHQLARIEAYHWDGENCGYGLDMEDFQGLDKFWTITESALLRPIVFFGNILILD